MSESSTLERGRQSEQRTDTSSLAAPPFDARDYRKALGRFPTGVAVMTALDIHGERIGMTVNSFVSVSLTPPIILWCIARSTPSYLAFSRASYFAVNVLAHDQQLVSNRFARASEDKFGGIDWTRGLDGVPLISGCAAQLECSLRERHVVGDHDIIFGNVERYTYTEEAPLAYALSGYQKVVEIANNG